MASPYDPIARIYDPWSRSVVEDVAFYVTEARKAVGRAGGGPVVELGVGTGRIAVPVAEAGVAVIGVDSSAGMLEVCRDRGRGGRRRRAPRPARQATCATRPSTERVPLVACPFRAYLHMETDADRRAALAAAHRLLLPGGLLAFDVFTPAPDDIAATNGRWIEREPGIWERADWDEAERRLSLSVRDDDALLDDDARLDLRRRVAGAARGERLRDRGVLRLVRPPPVQGRRGLDLARPAAVTR